MSASILHIAYHEALLEVREIMLKRHGYNVTSVLGNKEGLSRAQTGRFDAIVVGFSAPSSVRRDVISRIKGILPHVPVVALLAHDYEKLPEADCATLSE